jgi:hypothetical protein
VKQRYPGALRTGAAVRVTLTTGVRRRTAHYPHQAASSFYFFLASSKQSRPENYSPRRSALSRASHGKFKINILISPRSCDMTTIPVAQCVRHDRDRPVTKRLHLICDSAADQHVELMYAFRE